MQRIFIIGNGGSGKTTFARNLGSAIEMPVIHLDLLAWEKGWVKRTESEFTEKLNTIMQNPSWLMEGWSYQSTMESRLQKADVIFFLQPSLLVCWFNVLKRAFQNKWKHGAYNTPMSANVFAYLYVIWKVHKKYLHTLSNAINQLKKTKPICCFNTTRQAKAYTYKLKYGQRFEGNTLKFSLLYFCGLA